MMDPMTRDWARLGESLRAARVERGIEQQEAAAEIGVKRGALRNIEQGAIAKVTPTVRAYARLVGWTDDSVENVLAGGDPEIRTTDPSEAAKPAGEPTTGSDAAWGLSVRVQQSLREGPLIDSRVAEVMTPAGRVRATIVIRGEDGTSPEDLLAALQSLTIDVSADD